jgi:flagellar hook-associated protein 2
MSSPTSALSSLGSSSTAQTYFSGMSNYSASLNAEISQEVQIASLPIQLLQNDVNDLNNQTSELETLSGDIGAVQNAVSSLASAAGSMLTASVSDPTIATFTVGNTATAGNYTLAVANLGSYSNALSDDDLTTVTDSSSQNISASGSYTLTVTDGTGSPIATSISYSGGNLNGLAQAINDAGAGVSATVVDVGTNAAPDYRLSLQSGQLGPVTMQLYDGSQNLLTASGSPGALAAYTINGQPVQSDSDTVTLAPGLTAQLTGVSSEGTSTLIVAADPSGVESALQSFVSAYNSAMTELNNNRGQTDVALAGQSIVYQLTDGLQSLANYVGGGSSGNISSMAALGVSFDDTTGQLSFDPAAFDAATSGQSSALAQFLGSASSGGFLQMATNTMTGMLDPNAGIIPQELNSIQSDTVSTNSQIADKEAAVTQLQTNLTQQMAAADTLIYGLQQQATEMQDVFTAEQDDQMEASAV